MPNELQESLSALPAVDFSERTGFLENWSNALGLAITEDLPVTSRMIPTTTDSMRINKLIGYNKTGQISDEVMNYYFNDSKTDIDGLAEYANTKLGLADVPTKLDFEKQKLDEYADYRKTSQAVFDKQSKWGAIGQFAGSAHAIALDPLYAVSFFTGYGGAVTALQAGIRVGLLEGAVEALAQPLIYNFKDVVGADYSGAEAFTNIAFAAIGGGILGGAAKGVENLTVGSAKKLLDKYKDEALDSIKHVIETSDPEDFLLTRLQADEAVDTAANTRGPKTEADPDINGSLSAKEIDDQGNEIFTSYMAAVTKEKQRVADEKLAKIGQIEALDTHITDTLGPLAQEKSELNQARKLLKDSPEDAIDRQLIDDAIESVQQAIEEADIPSLMRARASLEDAREAIKAVAPEMEVVDKVVKEMDDIVDIAPKVEAKPKADIIGAEQVKELDPRTVKAMEAPIVRDSMDEVTKIDAQIKAIEECF